MQHVYIVGAKGIPARYGGFETFVEKLTEYATTSDIKYHVSSLRNNTQLSRDNDRFEHNGADVFVIDVPEIGAAKAIVYDVKALQFAIEDAKNMQYEKPIFYVLTSRIGPFIGKLKKQILDLGGVLFLNPDGNEWKRQKWSLPVRKYWKLSETSMVKRADLIIADNPKIEEYIHREYGKNVLNSVFIPYGTDTRPSKLTKTDIKAAEWLEKHEVKLGDYYLIVGRFVPENNYETMIREFVKSDTTKDLVIVSNVEENSFYKRLIAETGFDQDIRIKFVGTVYDQELLKFIRENAFAYLHGHEVGGTNPSLLEAMATTKLNLLIDVDFNAAVAKDAAMYWNKTVSNLATLINNADQISENDYDDFGVKSKHRIQEEFVWDKVVDEYEEVFLNYGKL